MDQKCCNRSCSHTLSFPSFTHVPFLLVPNFLTDVNIISRWASVYHYVNTPGDNPPSVCKCEYVPEGADVVNGILKMTTKLLQFKVVEPTTPEEKADREDALKFFIHFLGDVHQPLHASGKDRGGNNARAKWGRAGTSLHRIWDGQLILVSLESSWCGLFYRSV